MTTLTRIPCFDEAGAHVMPPMHSRRPGPLRRVVPTPGLCARVGCPAAHEFACTGCRVMSYCSEACQAASWADDGHSAVCAAWGRAPHEALASMRISAPVDHAEARAALVRAYTPDLSDRDPLDALYAGRAADILVMEAAEVAALMAHRKRIVRAVAARYYEELTEYSNHDLDQLGMEKWVRDLEAFAAEWDGIFERADDLPRVVLEKTWPGFDEDEVDVDALQEGLMAPATIAAARFFADSATTVSRGEFLGAATAVFRDIIDRARHEGRRIVWVNYATMNRSSSWMTLIMAHLFEDGVDDIVASYAELHALAASDRLGDEYANIAAVIPDDAAYTGKQLALKLRRYGDRLAGFAATDKIEHYLAVPYLTARAMLETGTSLRTGRGMLRVVAVGSSTVMRSFDEISRERTGNHVNVGAAHFIHDTYPGQVPIYFAHKLPDRISVPNNLFASAPYMVYDEARNVVRIKTRSFIKGCRGTTYEWAENPKARGADDHAVDYVQEQGKVCPFPIYKRVVYALDSGDTIAPDENAVLWADAHPGA